MFQGTQNNTINGLPQAIVLYLTLQHLYTLSVNPKCDSFEIYRRKSLSGCSMVKRYTDNALFFFFKYPNTISMLEYILLEIQYQNFLNALSNCDYISLTDSPTTSITQIFHNIISIPLTGLYLSLFSSRQIIMFLAIFFLEHQESLHD